jgi:hypothetical protein
MMSVISAWSHHACHYAVKCFAERHYVECHSVKFRVTF